MTPAVFVSHGMPAIVVQPGPTHHFFRSFGQTFDRPEAVICVSAHWEAVRPMLTTAIMPETIHDFSGPPILFEKQYPAPGDPELAQEALELLTHAGVRYPHRSIPRS